MWRNVINEDLGTPKIMRQRFSESLKRIVLRQPKEVATEAMLCLNAMLSTEELLIFVKTALTDALELEDEDKYNDQYGVLLDTLRSLYKKKGEHLREWLYKEMEKPDQKTAERAYRLYINLR
jgi:hypothetical protein